MTPDFERHQHRMRELKESQKHELIRTALVKAMDKWESFTVADIASFINGLQEKIK